MILEFLYPDKLPGSERHRLSKLYKGICPVIKIHSNEDGHFISYKVPDLEIGRGLETFYNALQLAPDKLQLYAIKVSLPLNTISQRVQVLIDELKGVYFFNGRKCNISFWNAVQAENNPGTEYKYYFNTPVIPQYPVACELYFKNIEKIFGKIPVDLIKCKIFWKVLMVNANNTWCDHFGENEFMKLVYDEVFQAVNNIKASCVHNSKI